MLTSSQWLWCISWSKTNISTSLLCFFSVIVGVVRQFPTMQKQILKPYVCNQCKINFFMFEKVSLYHTCNGGKVCLFQKYNILLLFLDHRFCLICLIIALVLLNHQSTQIWLQYIPHIQTDVASLNNSNNMDFLWWLNWIFPVTTL